MYLNVIVSLRFIYLVSSTYNCGPDHCSGSREEAPSDALESADFVSPAPDGWVHHDIEKRDAGDRLDMELVANINDIRDDQEERI